MAVKTKSKIKASSKVLKKAVKPAAASRKSPVSTGLAKARPATSHPKPKVKAAPATMTTKPGNSRTAQPAPKHPLVNPAIQAYEHGLKAMHAEEYEKAAKAFKDLLQNYPDEPEIQERARVLMQAVEKKLHEKARKSFKSADDHYNIGIAELNGRQLESAIHHFQSALHLTPKAEHILYAMAAAHAIQGNRDQAVTFLKQSLQYRPENRFLAARDSDFEGLRTDPEFLQLLAGPEKQL